MFAQYTDVVQLCSRDSRELRERSREHNRTKGPGVHTFATRYVPNAFIAQAQEAGTNTWQTIPDLVRELFAWWLRDGVVLTGQNNTHYHGDPFANDSFWISQMGEAEGVTRFYADVGVDWEATRAERFAANDFRADRNVMMYKINVQAGPGVGPDSLSVGDNVNPLPAGAGAVFGSDFMSGAAPLLLAGAGLWLLSRR